MAQLYFIFNFFVYIMAMRMIASLVLLHLSLFSCATLEVVKLDFAPPAHALTLVHISDLHMRGREPRYSEAARVILSSIPDMLVITGDLYSEAGHLDNLVWFLDQLQSVPHKAAILGNHEYWSGESLIKTREIFETRGWNFLVNETVDWEIDGRNIRVFGADDYLSGRWSLKDVNALEVDLFLIHEPELFNLIVLQNPELKNKLFLAGHTHGGQITFFGLPLYLPRGSANYQRGVYTVNGNTLFVSKGLGETGPPFRLFSNPDLAVIQF